MKSKVKYLIIALVAVAAIVCLVVGLSNDAAKQEEKDQAYHDMLIGAWVLLDDPYAEYDAEGNVTAFSVYEFTGTETYYHKVEAQITSSGLVNEYIIKDEKYTVTVDGVRMQQGMRFEDNGNLVLFTDTTEDEFRKLTDEEILEYGIPIKETTDGVETGSETTVDTIAETTAEE